MIGPMMDVDLDTEAGRYEARDAIGALLARWCASRSLDAIRQAFDGTGVLWGHFQDFAAIGHPRPALLNGEPAVHRSRSTRHRPLFDAGSAARFLRRTSAAAAPGRRRSGNTPTPCSAKFSGCSSAEIGRLHDARIVAGPDGR